MPTLRDLARSAREKAFRLKANADILTKNVAYSIHVVLAQATPIDTGRAVSNWRVSLGDAKSDFLDEAYFPGSKRSTANRNIDAAILQGKVAIAAYQFGLPIHIYNNVPYIGDLNRGTSGQAPPGFVQTSMLAGHAYAITVTSLMTAKLKVYNG
jgi:hypothetical protein